MATLKTLTINGKQYEVVSVAPTASVTLLADGWEGSGDAYSQVVELAGVTSHTKVDLQPTPEQVEIFLAKTVAFVAENNDGVVTVYSIGDKPKNDYTIQVTLTEVEGEAPIRGNTVGLPNAQPDWDQTDPRHAGYIKNKPSVISPTHSWNGTTLTITTASGTSSADLKGDTGPKGDPGTAGKDGQAGKDGAAGKDGYTPVRGKDYWTDADIAEIKKYIDENAGSGGVSSWNDLEDKPFGEEGGTETLMEEQTVEGFAYDSGYGVYGVGRSATFELVVGQTYQVIWDTSEHTCTAYEFASSGFTGVALGNESVMTGVSSDIVEPFVILYVTSSNYNSFFALDGSTDASHRVGIFCDTTVVTPLDARFLPSPVSIDLSAYESDGRIVETYADGSVVTTVMEFDENGKPTKITDSNGNVTVLTW